MATIKMTFGELGKLAERSPGYTVQVIDPTTNKVYTLTEIRFERRNGRRNRSVVLFACNGNAGSAFANIEASILD